MLAVVCSRVRPDRVEQLRAWMNELMERRVEVLETFAQETTKHEVAYLLAGRDGPILVYAIEAEDVDQASRAFRSSVLPIDVEHRHVMLEVIEGRADCELLYECAVPAVDE